MVRLLRSQRNHCTRQPLRFQSHNGAIAARLLVIDYLKSSGFNPTMVRLLRVEGG